MNIQPPRIRAMTSRPKKKRIREESEPQNLNRISKKGVKIKCSNYGEFGHNNKDYKQPINLNNKTYKRYKKKQPMHLLPV